MSAFDLCGEHASVLKLPEPNPLASFTDRIFRSYSCTSGNLSVLYPGTLSWMLQPLTYGPMSGAATESDEELAKLKAVCEAAERYSACVLLSDEHLVATANDLDAAAFDWRSLPRLSAAELRYPDQCYVNFDPDAPMRWIPAWSLVHRRRALVPIALTHLLPRSWTSERFCFRISTGLAVHTDAEAAMVTGLCECIERESIALTWLLRPRLRRIVFSDAAEALLKPEIYQVARLPEFLFFDATTDFGLPVIYLYRRRPAHPFAANLVTCAADFSYVRAIDKALREMASLSSMLDQGLEAKKDPMSCRAIEDGAVFMGRPERTGAFAFLMESEATIECSELERMAPPVSTRRQQLTWLVDRARQLGHDALVADLTPDELADAGLVAFRSLLPSLVPMTTDMRCRFLDTPRLAQVRRDWKGRIDRGRRINPYPQPFA